MLRGLQARIRALEAVKAPPAELRKSIVPEWLMDAWLEQGLRFDRKDENSLRQAIRASDPGLHGKMPPEGQRR